jgi:Kef-type K+ transport system membrane component KefB
MGTLQIWIHSLSIPILLLIGIVTLIGFYAGKAMRYVRLPAIVGFMIVGALVGPSLLDLIDEQLRATLSFVTEISLGFVALSIGLELSFTSLKQQGAGIIVIILLESFMAFVIVTTGIYLLTKDLSMALLFGAVAPASAPAGTVAVIQEYRAQGSLTRALYAVVGFDDGLGIIIFGFASAIARGILLRESGAGVVSLFDQVVTPLLEIGGSLLVGASAAGLFCLLSRKLGESRDIFILTFTFVLITTGVCLLLGTSFILTNMVLGIVVVNTQRHSLVQAVRDQLAEVMPLLFILFFVLAGANLHLASLPALGLLGLVYTASRSTGLMGGAWLGAVLGRMEKKIRLYLGMGILSQAGVAIGLALIVNHEFAGLSPHGAHIGGVVITSVTATCIFFEVIGPILTKIGLERAGEIQAHR